MKTPLLLCRLLSTFSFLAAILTSAPKATADAIEIVGDFQDCFVADQTPGLHTMTVVHRFNTGSYAARFRLTANEGMTMSYVSETHAWVGTLGNMRDGMSVCYGSCQVGETVLGTITYQGYGTSHSCAELIVEPHPDAETLDIVNCSNQAEIATTFHFEVGDPSGFCDLCVTDVPPIQYDGEPHLFDCQALPTSQSTWGAIKALYR